MRLIRFAFCGLISATTLALVPPEAGAQSCGTSVCTDGEICFAEAGEIVDGGPLCGLIFSGTFPVMDAALENLGGFPAGSQVRVEGCASPYLGICMSLAWSVRDNTIESLTPPVPALRRWGQAFAVLAVLCIGSLGVRRFRKATPRGRALG